MIVEVCIPDVIEEVDPTLRVHCNEVDKLSGENRYGGCFFDDHFCASNKLADSGFYGWVSFWVATDVTDEAFRGFDVAGERHGAKFGQDSSGFSHCLTLTITRFANVENVEVRI